MYSRHQKKLPVLQNGTDSFVVENGKRTDTKRIAHGYRKERPVLFGLFPFRPFHSVSLRSIPFTTCAPLQLKFSHSRCFRIFDATLSATRGPVQFSLRARLLHTRCSANLLPVARCSSTDVREIRVILLRSSALYSLFGGRTRFFSWYICILTASLIVPQRPSWLWPSVFASALAVSS